MANTPLRYELAKQAVDAVSAAVRGGFVFNANPSAIAEAARVLNLNEKTLHSRLRTARQTYGLEPEAVPPLPEVEFTPPAKPRVIVRAASEAAPEGEPIRICAIGDLHDAPEIPKDRLRWIGHHVRETRPDKVVQIGDIASFDSLSKHDAPGSISQKQRASFRAEMDSLEEALSIYRKALGDSPIQHYITLGNHEHRVLLWESATAELEGVLWTQLMDLFARYDWRVTDYKKYLFIAGTAWTHVPHNLMDKPYRGKTLNPIANDLVFSLVFGDSHRGQFLRVPKIGPQRSIEILNLGSAMPHGYFPRYNVAEQGGYSWGIYDVTVQGGHITEHRFIPMSSLEKMYG
jgi:hypothetical protein